MVTTMGTLFKCRKSILARFSRRISPAPRNIPGTGDLFYGLQIKNSLKYLSMKINKLFAYVAAFALLGAMATGCDNNMVERGKEIGLKELTLSQALSDGITMGVGQTRNISLQVTLTPKNATDRAENYSSSNPQVAVVNGKGLLTANSAGNSIISIMVGGLSVDFPLTVVPVPEIAFTTINIIVPDQEVEMGGQFDLSRQIITTAPHGVNDVLQYSSSDESVAFVDENGVIEGVGTGTVTITVYSKYDDSIEATITIRVVEYVDYARTGWAMSEVAHGDQRGLLIAGSNEVKNSLTAAFDALEDTHFTMVRPGKAAWGGHTVAAGSALFFVVDMQQSQVVNYFRILHRSQAGNSHVRWWGFDQILGSDDGVNFTLIAENVRVTDADVATRLLSPNIVLPNNTTAYRYIKFYAMSGNCYHLNSLTSTGSTTQITELYLGKIIR